MLLIKLAMTTLCEEECGGKVLDLRSRGSRFEPHWSHCIVSLSKTLNLCLVLVQPRKTRSDMRENLLNET